jgi:hypothetical protein
VDESQNALLIDEQPVRNHVEIKEATELASTVDHCRKLHVLRERSRPVGIDVDGDAQEGEFLQALGPLLQKVLPHGQLLTAASPAGPHEHEQPLTVVLVQMDVSSVQIWKGNRR